MRVSERSEVLANVRRHLEERRRDLSRQVLGKMREVRAANLRIEGAADEYVPSDSHDDLDPILMEMKSEMLNKVEAALRMIDVGQYGICIECHDHISQVRLIAIPFALRCTACQEKDEKRRPRRRVEAIARGEERGVDF